MPRISARPAQEPEQETRGPEWVREMQSYFSQTGTYRTKDLERVLGDPRKNVEIKTSSDFAFVNRKR